MTESDKVKMLREALEKVAPRIFIPYGPCWCANADDGGAHELACVQAKEALAATAQPEPEVDERAEFEEWVRLTDQFPNTSFAICQEGCPRGGEYQNLLLHRSWSSWQARANLVRGK